MSVCKSAYVPVRISVSSGGPITMLSLRRGPVGHLWRVLCSRQRQRCSLRSASCLRELCMVLGQGCWLDSGRTEHLLVPCRLELQCTQAAGPCTYERHCEKNDGGKVNIILHQVILTLVNLCLFKNRTVVVCKELLNGEKLLLSISSTANTLI